MNLNEPHTARQYYNQRFSRGYLEYWPKETILHILPCGNPGSFEHTICLLRKDGVDHQPGQRFFYENEGHIRCLTTVQLQQLYAGHGFDLVRACYNNHHDGAINKITHNPFRFVWAFADPSMAVDDKGRRTLRQWRVRLLAIWFLRSPAMVVEGKLRQRYRTLLDVIKLLVCLPLYPLAKPVDRYWQHRAHREWQRHKDESNGSEMFLVFRR